MKCYFNFAILAALSQLILGETPFEISIIHLNDFHAKFEPVSETTGTCHPGKNEQGLCYGGIARVATALKQLKETEPNPILLNAGDTYQGSLLYTLFKWNITVEFMNRLNFDAYALGNHEFDDGVAGIAPYLEQIIAPVVAVNMNCTLEPTIEGKYQPSTIIQRGDRNIGIIGTITKHTPKMANSENVIFYDEVTAVKSEVSKLKSQGVDIIVLLSHSGYDIDQYVAANIADIDIIVGAHSHSFLYTGEPLPSIEVPVGDYPTVVHNPISGKKTLIVQAYAYTKYLGFLKVQFDDNGDVVGWAGGPKLLDHTVAEDVDIKIALQPWIDTANKIGNQVLGTSAVILDGYTCYAGECSLGNFLTDAMVAEYVEIIADNSWTKAAIALMNPGGIRSSMGENPNITVNDLVVAQPFGNTIDIIDLQGKDIIEILEMTAFRGKDFQSGKGCMQVSGILSTYNFSNPFGSRLIDIKLKCADCRTPIFEDVDLEGWYTVAMPSYLSNGGSGFSLIPERGRNKVTGLLDIDVFKKYITKESPITQGEDKRIRVL